MKHKTIDLNRGERIIAVVPERCAGPGWSNSVTWVYIHNTADGTLRTECIQPEERTPALHALYSPGHEMVWALINTIPTRKRKNV